MINDGLLTFWLLGIMNEDIISSIFGLETAYEVWILLEQQLLPMTIEKEGHLKNMLMTIKKGSRSLEDYLKDFKSIYDTLVTIKQPVPDLDKVFQFARGLGPNYESFKNAMLIKLPYPSFTHLCRLSKALSGINLQRKKKKRHSWNMLKLSLRNRVAVETIEEGVEISPHEVEVLLL